MFFKLGSQYINLDNVVEVVFKPLGKTDIDEVASVTTTNNVVIVIREQESIDSLKDALETNMFYQGRQRVGRAIE